MTEKIENTGLSKEDLAAVLSQVIKAVKEPTAIEQRKLDAEQRILNQAQVERKNLAESVIQEKQQKMAQQRVCSHTHKNGDPHGVYITEPTGPGYILCQKNQCIIRPGVQPKDYKGNAIYDTALFNKIFQTLPNGEIFG